MRWVWIIEIGVALALPTPKKYGYWGEGGKSDKTDGTINVRSTIEYFQAKSPPSCISSHP